MNKAMILAAGRGERLRPITDTCPKPLVKVNGKPLIEHQIIKLKNAGVTDIMVNCAWLSELIIEFLDSGKPWGINIETVVEDGGALETAGGIINVLDFFDDEPFWVVSADIYSSVELSSTLRLSPGCLAHLFLVKNPAHNPDGDFFIDESGLLHREGAPKFTYANFGLYCKSLFDNLEPGKRKLAPLLRHFMDQGKIEGSLIDASWTDVGTIERLRVLEKEINN